jgi:hypothetical protein
MAEVVRKRALIALFLIGMANVKEVLVDDLC